MHIAHQEHGMVKIWVLIPAPLGGGIMEEEIVCPKFPDFQNFISQKRKSKHSRFFSSVHFPVLKNVSSFPQFFLILFSRKRGKSSIILALSFCGNTSRTPVKWYGEIWFLLRRHSGAGIVCVPFRGRELFVSLSSGLEARSTTIHHDVAPCVMASLPKRRWFGANAPARCTCVALPNTPLTCYRLRSRI